MHKSPIKRWVIFHPAMDVSFRGIYPVEVSGWTTAPLFGRVGLSEVVFGLHPGCHASGMFQRQGGYCEILQLRNLTTFSGQIIATDFPQKVAIVREMVPLISGNLGW